MRNRLWTFPVHRMCRLQFLAGDTYKGGDVVMVQMEVVGFEGLCKLFGILFIALSLAGFGGNNDTRRTSSMERYQQYPDYGRRGR